MRRWALVLGAAMVCAGCFTKPPKVALAPPAPPPKPDPPALIFPQTALELPDPQPVPPEAIPKREAPAPLIVSETPNVHPTPRKPSAPVRRESEESNTSTPPQSEPARAASTRTPLVPDDPDLPRSDTIQKRLDVLGAKKEQLSSKTGGNSEMLRGRIAYFIEQARQALARNDVRQADSLVSRAEVLAQDLLGVH